VRRALALGAVLVVAAAGSRAAVATRPTATPAQVVRAWSKALNANDNEAAASLFAPNALIVEGSLAARLKTHTIAVEFNDSLPCAGRVVAMTVKGHNATATFLLGHRPKHTCDGPGEKAAALFVVKDGKIVIWERVPVPVPKSNGI
jgi:limonene-1,2-epoxide hydrolase